MDDVLYLLPDPFSSATFVDLCTRGALAAAIEERDRAAFDWGWKAATGDPAKDDAGERWERASARLYALLGMDAPA